MQRKLSGHDKTAFQEGMEIIIDSVGEKVKERYHFKLLVLTDKCALNRFQCLLLNFIDRFLRIGKQTR